MHRIRSLWTSGRNGKIMILVGGLLGICVVCSVLTTLFPSQRPAPTTTQPGAQPPIAAAVATNPPQAPAATNTPAPPPATVTRPATNTPAPSNTPRPTNTPQPPPPTATPNVGKVGEAREAAGVVVTVNGVNKAQAINQFVRPTPGNVYLVADVTVGSNRDQETPYNLLYFKLKDDSGREYNTSLFAPEPSFKSGNLPKGDKARGNLAFEVPPDAKGFVLTYQPLVLLGGFQPIRIDLGQ